MFAVETENGKYMYTNNNGVVEIYNRGEYFGSGNKSVLSLLNLIEKQYRELLAYKNWKDSAGYILNANGIDDEIIDAESEFEEAINEAEIDHGNHQKLSYDFSK